MTRLSDAVLQELMEAAQPTPYLQYVTLKRAVVVAMVQEVMERREKERQHNSARVPHRPIPDETKE